METVVELQHFYFAYKKNNLVLHDIDFKIERGSFTVIAGPSGSGKTTLCKAMAGIVPFYMGGAYSGDVMVLGESTKGKKVSDIAMRLGLMLEDYESQLVSLTAGEEVAFSLLNHGFKPEEVEERTRRALEDVGLPGRESYQLDELSGGQRQRLLLASVNFPAVSASVCFWLRCLPYTRKLSCWTSLYRQWTRTAQIPCTGCYIKSIRNTARRLWWLNTASTTCCPT